MVAENFLNNLNPTERWEGKIDGTGKVIDSPIDLSLKSTLAGHTCAMRHEPHEQGSIVRRGHR